MTASIQILAPTLGRVARRARFRWLTWPRIALVAILALAAALGLIGLDREGWSNQYYAATVRSMLTGWQAFLFACYDPGCFVSVDKPPVGFWVQALSALVLGYNGVALLLPSVVAGVASVAVLHRLVSRTFGTVAGLVAALALALTPITVATNRNNTVDSLLVLVVLLAAWAVTIAAERGSLRWLVLGFALVGVGFNIKMLQAYLVLPALFAVYALTADRRRAARITHLAAAGVVLVAVSLSWAVAVDLTPADDRPYVGGSRTDSVLELALGYNGLSRLLGLEGLSTAPAPGGDGGSVGDGGGAPGAGSGARDGGGVGPASGGAPGGASGDGGTRGGQTQVAPNGVVSSIAGENGRPGPLRLLGRELGPQVSWLLPVAILGAVALAASVGRRQARGARLVARRRALVLWLAWLLAAGGFFSLAGFMHPYYLVMLAPAVAALVGAGLVALWRAYRADAAVGWLLPVALVATAALQVAFLVDYPAWARVLVPVAVALPALTAAGLVLARLGRRPRPGRDRRRRPALALVAAAMGALLVAPAVWGAIPVWQAPGDVLPTAGPRDEGGPGDGPTVPPGPGGGGRPTAINLGGGDDPAAPVDPTLVDFLVAHRGNARWLVATESSGSASPLIIQTGLPVMSLHGFGADTILSVGELAQRVRDGEVRFFLLSEVDAGMQPPGDGTPVAGGDPAGPAGDAAAWVRDNCRPVPEAAWRSSSAARGPERLWDCGEAT